MVQIISPDENGSRGEVPAEIAISREHRAQLRRALDQALPRECCGVLLGHSDHGRIVVCRVLVTTNSSGMAGCFSISDQEVRRVRLLSALERKPITAVFHSHPHGSLELSQADRMALSYSEWPWVVITPAIEAHEVRLAHYRTNG